MRNAPTNSDDVIDSRDVIARIEELQDERDGLAEAVEEADTAADDCDADDADLVARLTAAHAEAKQELTEWDEGNAEELRTLTALQNEAEGYAPDWLHGATLIRHDYFTEYAEGFVKDVCDLPKDIPFYIVIDWEATAKNIKMDYTSVDFDGVEYWVR